MLLHPHSLFGLRLRTARVRAQIPQDRLGVLIGLDEGSSSARISRYETGTHEPPFKLALKIAEVLSVPVAYFYCPDDLVAQVLIELHRFSSTELTQLLVDVRKTNDERESAV